MLNIRFLKRRGLYAGFVASGHAGYGKRGSDIVCAGASALLQTVALELKRLKVPIRSNKKDGRLTLRVRPRASGEQRAVASILLRGAHTGAAAMEVGYGKNIRVTVTPIYKRKREV